MSRRSHRKAFRKGVRHGKRMARRRGSAGRMRAGKIGWRM